MRSRHIANIVAYSLLFLSNAASAEDARAILDRAIQAHGGGERLEHTKKGHLKANTEESRPNPVFRGQIEEWFDLPNRYNRTVDGSRDGIPHHVEDVYTGKERWTRIGTDPGQLNPVRQPQDLLQNWYAVLALLLSLRDKDSQLKTLPDETKDGRTLVGFHRTSPEANGDFYFDKSTGRLARARRETPELPGGPVVVAETFYEDYRDIEGVQYPMRFKTVVGKDYSNTITLSSIEFGNIDEKVFTLAQTSTAEDPAEHQEQSTASRENVLVFATVGAGLIVGALWFIVRASKRGKRDVPTS